MTNTTKTKKHGLHRHMRPIVPDDYKVNIVPTVQPARYFRRKGVPDRVLAVLLLIPCLPITAVLILLVKLTSRGPAIYSQCRLGRDGRKFNIYKLRTMIHNAEARTGPIWTQAQDARVTRLGRLLRKFHLDELPQLFNVLKGEMSLVGPRPERPEFVEVLTRQIPEYSNRMVVRPGVTGLAQLNLPPDSDLTSVRRKLVLDLEYIEKAGLFLDFRLTLCTALRVLKLPVLRVLGLHRMVVLPALPSGNGNHAGSANSVTPKSIVQHAVAHPAAGSPAGHNGKRLHGNAEPQLPRKPK
jgi:lipopolysaccharide/colanic/teichoic acid biosynthesis glycosyltransferase